jgi:hypothetical protein
VRGLRCSRLTLVGSTSADPHRLRRGAAGSRAAGRRAPRRRVPLLWSRVRSSQARSSSTYVVTSQAVRPDGSTIAVTLSIQGRRTASPALRCEPDTADASVAAWGRPWLLGATAAAERAPQSPHDPPGRPGQKRCGTGPDRRLSPQAARAIEARGRAEPTTGTRAELSVRGVAVRVRRVRRCLAPALRRARLSTPRAHYYLLRRRAWGGPHRIRRRETGCRGVRRDCTQRS